jgi:ADP-ribosyl-[dinitrogen reductase] hydrolase
MEVRDRVVGGVLGLALGDALGAPFEFLRARNVPDPIPALELEWLDLPPGSTTDDTAMARNLVRSLAERDGLDVDDLVRRHVAWFASDPPDVGTLTRRVLRRIADEPEPTAEAAARAAAAIWRERGPEVSAGNGSVMYCPPLGFAYANRPGRLLELAPALSAITHADERCKTAVLAITLVGAALVRGEDRRAAAEAAVGAVLERDGGEELEFLVEHVGRSRPVDGPDQGFCLFTAGVAFQALLRFEAFEPALRHVVSLGGDTDTNGAVAGGLLGASVGVDGLPAAWLARLREREAISNEAAQLVPIAEATEISPIERR